MTFSDYLTQNKVSAPSMPATEFCDGSFTMTVRGDPKYNYVI